MHRSGPEDGWLEKKRKRGGGKGGEGKKRKESGAQWKGGKSGGPL